MTTTAEKQDFTAPIVDYWRDLSEMPKNGPFLCTGAPLGGGPLRIEHARGPTGVGCPQVPCPELRAFMTARGIPRGLEGATMLNKLFAEGELVWDGVAIKPVTPSAT
jgi:hypothetical protein